MNESGLGGLTWWVWVLIIYILLSIWLNNNKLSYISWIILAIWNICFGCKICLYLLFSNWYIYSFIVCKIIFTRKMNINQSPCIFTHHNFTWLSLWFHLISYYSINTKNIISNNISTNNTTIKLTLLYL